MREVIVRTNNEVRDQLSKDLGAFAGLLFEIGAGRLLVDGNVEAVLQAEKAKAEKVAKARHAAVLAEEQEESEHTQIQYLLIKVGRALKYDVYVARNDRHRSYDGQAFALLTIPTLPPMDWPPEVMDTTSLIDVIWLKPGTNEIVSAFEIEKSTSIYSGILRMEDLARSIPECTCHFYLVAPNRREKEVIAQLARPAFRNDLADLSLAFIPFDSLRDHCDALCKFGEDHTILRKIAQGSALV
jgi:type II restriction enzyme